MAPPKKTFLSSSNFATNQFAESPEDQTSANSEGSGHWGSPEEPQHSGLTPPPRDSPSRSPNTPVKPPGTSPEANTLPASPSTAGPSGIPPRRPLSPPDQIEPLYLSNSEKSDENLEEDVFGIPPQTYSQAASQSLPQAARCLDYGL